MRQPPEDPTRRLTELTAHLQAEIDGKLRQGYPFIGKGGAEAVQVLDRYNPEKTPLLAADSLTYVSFDPTRYKEPLTNQVLQIALSRSANSNDPAYSSHGAEHVVFQEAVKKLTQAIRNRDALTTVWQPHMVKSDLEPRQEFLANRLIIETLPFERTSARPEPYVKAIREIRPRQNKIPNELRKIARSDFGMAQAVLTGFYAGLTPEALMTALDEPHLKQELADRRLPYLTANRASDRQLLRHLSETMLIEVSNKLYVRRSSEAYLSALATLEQAGFLPHNASHLRGFSFTEFADTVTARAVFVGLSEIAQKTAPLEYRDPARTAYVDSHYGKLATSILATAFIPEEI